VATYIYSKDQGRMVDKETGEPMNADQPWRPTVPMVFSDLPGYVSPASGEWVEGRRARKYDMEKNNCVDGNDFIPSGGRGLKNERFAKKRGLEHLLK